jgi:CRISPR-associated protein Cas1
MRDQRNATSRRRVGDLEPLPSGIDPEVSAAVQQVFDSISPDASKSATASSIAESEAAAPSLSQVVAPPVADPAPLVAQPPAEPLPARMLNEFVYCPRLFYYEHVEGVFVDNADTFRGAALHTRVDKGSGALPDATEPVEPEVIHSRSVSLSSDRLGVTAKMDLVEVRTAGAERASELGELFAQVEVCPVDYKAGAPREGDAGKALWDTDKMQLALQCLILRDNGYACSEGVIYYRGTKQRVRLEITPDIEAWVMDQIGAARRAMIGSIPAPLFDSPKCPRCSLVTVCLPDETRLLAAPRECEANDAAEQGMPPRRLIAPRDDKRALYLTTPGLYVGRSGEVLQISESAVKRKRAKQSAAANAEPDGAGESERPAVQEVRINDLANVALFGNIQISTSAVQALCEADVPLTYFSMGGWFYGITRGHSLKNVFTRVEQFRLARDPAVCLWLARSLVAGKIRNHRTMLMRNHIEPPAPVLAKLKNSAARAIAAESIEELLGIEGAAAAFYFQHFDGMIKTSEPGETATSEPLFQFDFHGRSRRPPCDPVNALLSLAYSLLAKDCTIAAYSVGLDPYIGFYHQPRFGRPALALDIMEEFRPLVAESCVLSAINNRMINERDFVRAGRAVNLTAAGRRQFFVAYETRLSHLVTHPVFDYKVTYRRAIELQFRILARYLTGEIEEYIPFTTR